MQDSNEDAQRTGTEYCIRFLSAALAGAEYILEPGVTLLRRPGGNEESADDVHVLYVPGLSKEEELYLICESDGILRMSPAAGEEVRVEANVPLHAGSLVFAIRQQAEEWSETVLSFRAGETEGAGVSGTEAGSVRFPRLRGGLQKKLSAACLVLTVLSLLAGTGWFYTRQEREMNDAVRAMAGGTEKVTSFRGRDGKVYFLTETEGARNWALQVAMREPEISQAQIINRGDELRRITEWLSVNMPGVRFHRLSLDTPLVPVLFISQERTQLTSALRTSLVSALRALMPWVQDIHFTMVSDQVVASESEEALKKVTTDYVRRYTDSGVTFSVTGELDDGLLSSLRHLIERQQRLWSGGYVYYELELKQDWLRGKSFKYGSEGYVKSGREHWYFSGPLKINTQHDDRA